MHLQFALDRPTVPFQGFQPFSRPIVGLVSKAFRRGKIERGRSLGQPELVSRAELELGIAPRPGAEMAPATAVGAGTLSSFVEVAALSAVGASARSELQVQVSSQVPWLSEACGAS